MGIRVNLAGVKTELVPVPAGRYRANVFAMGLKTSKNDNEMLEVQYKISPEDPHEEEIGRTMYDNLVLIPNSLWRLKRTLIALGDDPADLDIEFEIDADFIEAYIGRECVIDIKHEMYQGEARARISRVLPADAPLDQETLTVGSEDII